MTDLPEPKRRVLTPAEALARERKLLTTLAILAVAYSCLHKLLVPIALKGTALATSPYSKIDVWWAHSAALLFCLCYLPQTERLLSLLAGAGVVYGAVETAEAFLGHLPGWLAISRLLSSIPIAGICIAILTSRRFPVRPGYAWAGVGISGFVLYVSLRVLR